MRKTNKNLNGKQLNKETVSETVVKRDFERNRFKNVSIDEFVREKDTHAEDVINKRPHWGRKLGELSKNTKTEIFKQFSNFDI